MVKLEENESQFFALHRSERVDCPEAVLLASPHPEITIWNFAGSIRASDESADQLIDGVEGFFEARAMAPSFKTNALTVPDSLPRMLERLGYLVSARVTTMLYGGAQRVLVQSSRSRVERIGIDKIESFTITQLGGFESSQDWLPWFIDTNHSNVQREDHAYYLAYYQDEPAGVMLTLTEPEGVCGIYAVATLPQWRGRGIATELFAHAISDAERAGCELITLSTATGGPAEKYFQKLGFRPVYISDYFVNPPEQTG